MKKENNKNNEIKEFVHIAIEEEYIEQEKNDKEKEEREKIAKDFYDLFIENEDDDPNRYSYTDQYNVTLTYVDENINFLSKNLGISLSELRHLFGIVFDKMNGGVNVSLKKRANILYNDVSCFFLRKIMEKIKVPEQEEYRYMFDIRTSILMVIGDVFSGKDDRYYIILNKNLYRANLKNTSKGRYWVTNGKEREEPDLSIPLSKIYSKPYISETIYCLNKYCNTGLKIPNQEFLELSRERYSGEIEGEKVDFNFSSYWAEPEELNYLKPIQYALIRSSPIHIEHLSLLRVGEEY